MANSGPGTTQSQVRCATIEPEASGPIHSACYSPGPCRSVFHHVQVLRVPRQEAQHLRARRGRPRRPPRARGVPRGRRRPATRRPPHRQGHRVHRPLRGGGCSGGRCPTSCCTCQRCGTAPQSRPNGCRCWGRDWPGVRVTPRAEPAPPTSHWPCRCCSPCKGRECGSARRVWGPTTGTLRCWDRRSARRGEEAQILRSGRVALLALALNMQLEARGTSSFRQAVVEVQAQRAQRKGRLLVALARHNTCWGGGRLQSSKGGESPAR